MTTIITRRAKTAATTAILSGTGSLYEAGKLTAVTPDASSAEWLKSSGLDWRIETAPLQYSSVNRPDTTLQSADHCVQYSSATGEVLAVTSPSYVPVQPADAVRMFADSTDYELQSAGSLRGGRTVWAYVKGPMIDIGDDNIQSGLLYLTENDGSGSTRVIETTTRLACTNQLHLIALTSRNLMRWCHRQKIDFSQVEEKLTINLTALHNAAARIETLASTGASNEFAVNYFAQLFVKKDSTTGNITNEAGLEKIVNRCMALWKTGKGSQLTTAKGTQWGLVNAVTDYLDHEAACRNVENRWLSNATGEHSRTKIAAVKLLDDGGKLINEMLASSGTDPEPVDDSFSGLMNR